MAGTGLHLRKDAAHRYSPAAVVAVSREVVSGAPLQISTSYVEREHLSLRMSSRRFTRLTNGFSKNLDNHIAAVSLYVAHYNFCRVLPLPFNFASVTPTTGVYIIWHGGPTPRTVRVGQGDIASRLSAHSRDREITGHATFGGLLVTWAAVPPLYLDGVERFLADRLNPLVGDRFPDRIPIPVNLPWAA